MQAKDNREPKKKRSVAAKIANVLSWILVCTLGLFLMVFIFVQTPPGQSFVRGKVQSFLQKKLNTKVVIGELDIDFPNSVILKNVYIEDQTKDTLISGGMIRVDLNMLKLLDNEIQIKEINLENITAKIKRVNQDTVFNFQFVVAAFMNNQKDTSVIHDSSTLNMNIDNIVLNNIRLIYQDVITGDDMDLFITHMDAPIKKFDPARLYFDIPTFTLTGLRGHYYQNEPLKPKIDSAIAEAILKPENFFKIKNREILLKDIDVDYRSAPTNITTYLKLNKLVAHPDTLDVKTLTFAFKDITLDSSDVAVDMGPKRVLPKSTAVTQLVKEVLASFSITSDKITINESTFRLNNSAMPVTNYGMDYGHLDIKKINLTAVNLLYNIDTTMATIKTASLTEKSGFVLNELNADFLFTNTGTSLKNLFLKTPGTILRRDLAITYPSLERLAQNPATLVLDLDIESSSVQVKDILTFAPLLRTLPAFSNPSQVWDLHGKVYGPVSNMQFNELRFKGLTNTTLFVTGSLLGLPDPKKFTADLNIKYLNTGAKDILSLMPPGSAPLPFTLPASISARGRIKTSMNDLVSDVTVSTSLGSAKLKGSLTNYSNPKLAKYDYAINATRLDLGTIMKDKAMFGTLSANFKVKGSGLDPNTANAVASGVINSIGLKKYTYTNIKFNGSIANGSYTANASVKDPNIDLSFVADGIFKGAFPSLRFTADIDSIKTHKLNLTTQTVFYHGKIEGDLNNINPDSLDGNLLVTNSVLVTNGERTQLDSVRLFADNSGGQQLIRVQSPFMFAEIQGQYKLTQLGDIIQQSIDPYFAITKTKNTNRVDAHNFIIKAKAFDNPALRVFMPELKKMDSINLSATFSSLAGMNAKVSAPVLVYGPHNISGLNLNVITRNNQLEFTSGFSQFKSGSFAMYATELSGNISNNFINFSLGIRDNKAKYKYQLAGILSQPTLDNYLFQLKPDSLMLNYEPWSVNANNSLQLLNGELIANQLVLNKGDQQLSINSVGSGNNRPVRIDFKNFNIATLAAFVQTDSLLVNGSVNGNAMVKNFKTQPTFTSDLTVTDLSINKDTLGNLTAQVNNNTANVFNANVVLSGRGNDLKASGVYNVRPDNKSSFEFNVDIERLQMKSLEGPSMGAIRNGSGTLSGKISLRGTIDDPELLGKVDFDNTAFTLAALGSFYRINNESLTIDNNGFIFDSFTIQDSSNNDLVIDGRINTLNFTNYGFDLKVNADNFQAINTTKKTNDIYYGKMVLSAALNIRGTNDQPVVDGAITVNDQTNFTVVLPQAQPGIVEREGVVRFVDLDATPQDSLFLLPYDSLNVSRLAGFDISTNITIDREAIFNLIVDAGNGDFISMKGEGLLNAGIDPSGKITLVGSYELDEGSYEISFNFLRRKFDIQKGSRILWTGEPTNADINVSAVYIANTSPLDLVQNQLGGDDVVLRTAQARQRLPFQVWLTLKGELLKPAITFDIRLPEDRNYVVDNTIVEVVQNRLLQIRQEPGEINKQVFALLLLNRFVSDNPFASSNGGLDPMEFAKQSVSKLLTEQLNNLAGGLISGVDINFDLTTAADYTTGEKRSRTDFTVALTKQLMGDRLTVRVGSNFELEGPTQIRGKSGNNIAGNVAIDYKLSRDGRYVIRVYRKNEYEGVIEGYIIESGIGFIININYDHFRELLQRSKRNNKGKVPVISPSADRSKIADPPKSEIRK